MKLIKFLKKIILNTMKLHAKFEVNPKSIQYEN